MTTAAVNLLTAAYSPLIAFAEAVDEEQGWRATQLPGWTVRDLIWHLTGDGQRALVALATPAHPNLDWTDSHYARAGTGRLHLTADERAALGPLSDRFPLFG